jgi:hypothetical protein
MKPEPNMRDQFFANAREFAAYTPVLAREAMYSKLMRDYDRLPAANGPDRESDIARLRRICGV